MGTEVARPVKNAADDEATRITVGDGAEHR
jgi:hypothetical protein